MEVLFSKEIADSVIRLQERFASMESRYAEFDDVLRQLQQRVDGHMEAARDCMSIAREEQAVKPTLFKKRNQGRINAKVLGAIERNAATVADIQEGIRRDMELVVDTGRALRHDLREVIQSVEGSLNLFQTSLVKTLQLMGTDIEMLKQLAAEAHLTKRNAAENP